MKKLQLRLHHPPGRLQALKHRKLFHSVELNQLVLLIWRVVLRLPVDMWSLCVCSSIGAAAVQHSVQRQEVPAGHAVLQDVCRSASEPNSCCSRHHQRRRELPAWWDQTLLLSVHTHVKLVSNIFLLHLLEFLLLIEKIQRFTDRNLKFRLKIC